MFKITIDTKETFTNITQQLQRRIAKERLIGACLIVLYVPHTTAAIMILEDESLLKKDMEQFLEMLAPRTLEYRHDDIRNRTVPPGERINGFSHLRALFLNGSSTIVPAYGRELQLGKWQSIFLVELDPFRKRDVYAYIIGVNNDGVL